MIGACPGHGAIWQCLGICPLTTRMHAVLTSERTNLHARPLDGTNRGTSVLVRRMQFGRHKSRERESKLGARRTSGTESFECINGERPEPERYFR